MREGRKAEIELKPRCSCCEGILEYTSCIECQKPIFNKDSWNFGNIQIYCFGPKGETWHMCEPCHIYLENLKCPKCKGKEISRYGKDTKEGVMIVNTCLKTGCHSTWEVKRGG